ncbi:STAS domain-containing protein [Thiorhodovibrio litoralis]|uniref:STAS domain-containing protein n=1 Tax=Thiorhodovibrio litoralis TaxID=2952932 RepID=UPI00389AEAE7
MASSTAGLVGEDNNMSFSVSVKSRGDNAYIVYPEGSLNSDTAPGFERQIDEVIAQQPHLMVLDLEKLNYISSAGIRVLLKAKKDMKAIDGKVSFMHLQPPVRKVFDIINALPSLSIFASIQEMDDYLDAMQQQVGGGQTLDD